MERSKNLEKQYFITVQNNSSSWEGLTVETHMGCSIQNV